VSLPDVLEAATAIAGEATQERVLDRLAKAVTFVSGGTGCVISRVDRRRLIDVVAHALRHVDLGEDTAYLIDDFPVTREVLDRAEPRSISFLDEDLDQAEAFVLRELRMNACLLVPIVLDGVSWGLVEVYDMRLRRFGDDSSAAVGFLTTVAASRLDALGELEQPRRRLPLFRLPSAG
jgi:transcriptional regulator with GAF, ATPase, and Fis domain